jgi:hypothetical protein
MWGSGAAHVRDDLPVGGGREREGGHGEEKEVELLAVVVGCGVEAFSMVLDDSGGSDGHQLRLRERSAHLTT